MENNSANKIATVCCYLSLIVVMVYMFKSCTSDFDEYRQDKMLQESEAKVKELKQKMFDDSLQIVLLKGKVSKSIAISDSLSHIGERVTIKYVYIKDRAESEIKAGICDTNTVKELIVHCDSVIDIKDKIITQKDTTINALQENVSALEESLSDSKNVSKELESQKITLQTENADLNKKLKKEKFKKRVAITLATIAAVLAATMAITR